MERSETKRVKDMELSARIKDFMREGQIPQIVSLLTQVLQNYTLFEERTVRGALKVIATLSDWN